MMRATWFVLALLFALSPVVAQDAPATPDEDAAKAAAEEAAPEAADAAAEEAVPADADEGATGAIEEFVRLEETVVSATRTQRLQFDLPRSTTVISNQEIQQQQPGHLIEVIPLRDAGIIMDIRTASTGDPDTRPGSTLRQRDPVLPFP